MCGIVCALEIKQHADELRPQLLEMSKRIRHRGPDWSAVRRAGFNRVHG